MTRLVFLGPPSVGKGTIAKMVQDKINAPQISTGDLLRNAVENKTELGIKAKGFMDSGDLVPDRLVIDVLKKKIYEMNSFILDGFPRTISQAEVLDKEVPIDKVIYFEAPDEMILRRITGRRTCRKCGETFHVEFMPPKVENVCDECGGELYERDDQKPNIVKERLDVYKKETEPLVNYYKEKGLLETVDASGTDVEVIYAEALKKINGE